MNEAILSIACSYCLRRFKRKAIMEVYEASRVVTQLFDSDYSILVRYALQTTHDFEVAEDVVQEAMMLLYKELRKGRDVDNPKAWTFCVVRRLISKQARANRRMQELSEPLSAFYDSLSSPMSVTEDHGPDELSGLLSVLSPREQEVVLLRMTALKYREIADRLGISPKSVNTFLARALRKLQKAASGNSIVETRSQYVEPVNPKTL